MAKLLCDFQVLKKRIERVKNVVLYGAHRIAEDVYELLRYYNMYKKVSGFAVTDEEENPKTIASIPVKSLEKYKDIRDEKVLVIIAMPEKFFAEVAQKVKRAGFEDIFFVEGRLLAHWENKIVIEKLNDLLPDVKARQDENEYLCIRLELGGHSYKLMALGTFPFHMEYIDTLRKIENIWEKCGSPMESVHLDTVSRDRNTKNISVYVACSTNDIALLNGKSLKKWEFPVIGGAALKKTKNEMQRDNEGINISTENKRFSEMTVAYWAWKNSDADYIGLEHYRRRYLLSEEQLIGIADQNVDVILTRPRIVFPNIKVWLPRVSCVGERDIDMLIQWLIKKFPQHEDHIEDFFEGNIFYPNNMVIAKKEIYAEYCEWLFHILFELDKTDSFSGFQKKNRYAGYIAELLTSYYFMLNQDQYKMIISDYELLS